MNLEEEILITSDPYNELLKASTKYKIDLKKLDFQILGFNTSYSIDEKEQNKLNDKELGYFDNDENFLQANLKITQEYKIKISEKSPAQTELSQRIKLISDKTTNKLIAVIELGGLEFYKSIAMDILQDIYKKMIKEEFFIGIRIFDFKQKLIDLLNELKEQKLHRKKAYILVCKGVHSISAESEKLVLAYRENFKQEKVQKVSIIGVNEGDLVLKHITPGLTREGKNLKLEPIKAFVPPEKKIEFSCSANFELTKMNENTYKSCIGEYKAKKKGFVSEMNHNFEIENELNLSSVNFKDTGAICAGLDKNVTINIRNASELEEAVGSGVYIECENLTINGNVAGNTTLKAKVLKIYGHTHSTSKMSAEQAYISTHRGYLEAKEADIDSIENGSIKADLAKIKKSLGANITAKKVSILTPANNNTIIFSQIAYVDQCQSGTNNKFHAQVIDFKDDLQAKLKQIQERQKALPALIENLKHNINSSKNGVETLLKTIAKLKSQNQAIPPNFAPIIKEFQNFTQELNKLQLEENELNLEEQKIIKTLGEAQDELLEAQVINKGGVWGDMNEIKFKFLFPKSELLHATSANEVAKRFFVKRDFDNEGKIKLESANEYNEKDIEWSQPSKA
ncbi:DUF342 domain-containing protein [Campylobacter sp. MIT 12-8780]|uniref:DUF342 domain-containing protein n=1 Tax=unclassified Campylobacter TaxID=2593542 RepID=UPI00115E9876|nr:MULTISPECIES: DUF342 domain-containing protein [unclassified Campylobacter]NDJ27527.1 DUF342 domain-containing protein [Campylobacter sp. MIT 19-121]TQR41283.1 DUF342 domain-containing protein [Campylobacter sp. MIT 12-8780]